MTQLKESLTKELDSIKFYVVNNKDKWYIQSCGWYELPIDLNYNENELSEIRDKRKSSLKERNYYKCINDWVINGNTSDGSKLAEFLCKTCITAFNLSCDAWLEKLSISNLENIKE